MTLARRLTPALLALLTTTGVAAAQEPIKIGVLHSPFGTTAIWETTPKDVMLIQEKNKKGAGRAGRWRR